MTEDLERALSTAVTPQIGVWVIVAPAEGALCLTAKTRACAPEGNTFASPPTQDEYVAESQAHKVNVHGFPRLRLLH